MISVNVITVSFAALPILFLLVSIILLNWGIAKAAPIGMLIAGSTAIVCFGSSFYALFFESLKGLWNALVILLVVWPAVFSYELTSESKGINAIKMGIQKITKHELLQIMILGWIFPSFLQGITGFGVAVAVGAPLLVSIGLKPLWSIIIVLVCHSWGATFGTLALAWEALINQVSINNQLEIESAILAALMIWIVCLVGAICLCWFYGSRKALREGIILLIIFSLIMGGGQLVLVSVNTTIACFLPASIALALSFLIGRLAKYQQNWSIEDSPIMEKNESYKETSNIMSFNQAFLPYYSLAILTVICLLIPPINRILGAFKIGFSFPETTTSYGVITERELFFSPFIPLTYAGTFLALACLISYYYYRKKSIISHNSLNIIWKRTYQKCIPSTIAIISLIIMSKFMSSSGQVLVLSESVINLLGNYYIVVSPLLGMLGAFITSSNMSSNILFGQFQATASSLLDVNPAILLALQTVGGVLGTAFSPASVILGTITTGLIGKEGKILKIIIPISFTWALIFGLFFLILNTFNVI